MAEAAQQTETPPQPAPKPDKPRKANGRFAQGARGVTAPFEERMAKKAAELGEVDDDSEDTPPKPKAEAKPATKGKPASAKAEPKPAEKPKAPAATKPPEAKPKAQEATPVKTEKPPEPPPRRETIEVSEDQKPKEKFTKERLAFDDYRRRTRAAHEAQMAADRNKLAEERTAWESQRKAREERDRRADAIIKAYEDDDPDGLARALGKHKDWNEMNGHFIAVTSDPHYKTTRELREWKDQQEQQKREDAAKAEQEAKAASERTKVAEREQAIRQHKQGLSATMAKSSHKLVAAMHDDPAFVNTVFAIQREHYHETGTELAPEQAIQRALRGGNRALLEELQDLRERLNRGFAEDEPEPAEEEEETPDTEPAPPPVATRPAPKPPKTAVVPPSRTPEPAAEARGWKKTKDPRWRQHFADRMAQADEEDEEQQRRRRLGR